MCEMSHPAAWVSLGLLRRGRILREEGEEGKKERLVKRGDKVAKLNLETGALSARWPSEGWVPSSSFPSPFHLL